MRLIIILIQILMLTTWMLAGRLTAQTGMSSAEKEAVVEHLSTLMEQNYVFPARAMDMSAMIKRKLKQGEYGSLESPAEFAEVFILTSPYTFSAAEEFTYNLKNLEKATVVGQTTGGGVHPGEGQGRWMNVS